MSNKFQLKNLILIIGFFFLTIFTTIESFSCCGGGVGDPGGGNGLETHFASKLKLAISEMLPLRDLLEKNYWLEDNEQKQLDVSLKDFFLKIGGKDQSSAKQLEYLRQFLAKLEETQVSCQPVVAAKDDASFCKLAGNMYGLSLEKCEKNYIEKNRLAIGKPYHGLLVRENIWNQTFPVDNNSLSGADDLDTLAFVMHEVAQNCMGLKDSAQEGHPLSSSWYVLYTELHKIQNKLAAYEKYFPRLIARGILDRKKSKKIGGAEYFDTNSNGARYEKSYCESLDGPLYLVLPQFNSGLFESKIPTETDKCVSTLEAIKEYDEIVILEYSDITASKEAKYYRIKGKRNQDTFWTNLYEYK
jgi:hypothetical protein